MLQRLSAVVLALCLSAGAFAIELNPQQVGAIAKAAAALEAGKNGAITIKVKGKDVLVDIIRVGSALSFSIDGVSYGLVLTFSADGKLTGFTVASADGTQQVAYTVSPDGGVAPVPGALGGGGDLGDLDLTGDSGATDGANDLLTQDGSNKTQQQNDTSPSRP